ncbi:MAG: NAD(P)/FAD-dependent oxidoreductase [Prevotella sp.]|nr:NAD(P)/FAD-dependent oxidoreductase [Prevotella sp.]
MKTAVIGGGAAGFFTAICLKEQMPQMDVTIFERSQRVLAKVAVSGGGRCNCTNTFRQVRSLQSVYPRGHRLLQRLFRTFSHDDARQWFERHGVPLVAQDDECIFPAAQDSRAIIDCFLSLASRYHIKICKGVKIRTLTDVCDFDYVVVTTGGSPQGEGLRWLADLGHETVPPVPSLFSLSVNDSQFTALQGLVVNPVTVLLPGTKHRATGPLLITHWGVSGPAVLKLSSYAARHLAECSYQSPLSINWLDASLADADGDVAAVLHEQIICHPQKQLHTHCPFGLQQRLWSYLLDKSLGTRSQIRWADLNQKDINRLLNTLQNDTYQIAGRAPFKDEFVTCGGISLRAVNPSTLESRHVPRLYFAGEVLDIDGITGGFNFQAAWTTAYVVAHSISAAVHS